ncbi:hypothetical protein [Streptomyces sp. NRRL B-24572]|uniref:hypothetical protein n=1 Tax=Streptomyces sp. NRRL B-24572 TaxID=1962156 RepID=UPI00117D4A5D|nr:hypothetical protein [Streptomyces sp. NRRL B-24572]
MAGETANNNQILIPSLTRVWLALVGTPRQPTPPWRCPPAMDFQGNSGQGAEGTPDGEREKQMLDRLWKSGAPGAVVFGEPTGDSFTATLGSDSGISPAWVGC